MIIYYIITILIEDLHIKYILLLLLFSKGLPVEYI